MTRRPSAPASSSFWRLDDEAPRPDARPRRPSAAAHAVRRTLLRGVVSGMAGAAVASLWLLAVDLWRGHPLDTPATLCAHITHAFGSSGWRGARQLATLFTGVTFAVFVVVGVLMTSAARGREGRASGLAAALLIALVLVGAPLHALMHAAGAAVAPNASQHVVAAHLVAVAITTVLSWVRWRDTRAGHRAASTSNTPSHPSAPPPSRRRRTRRRRSDRRHPRPEPTS